MFSRTEKQTWAVEGMTCGHCEQRVEQSVGKIEGVRKVRASHKDKSVEIVHKKGQPLNSDLIRRTITDLGFEVV